MPATTAAPTARTSPAANTSHRPDAHGPDGALSATGMNLIHRYYCRSGRWRHHLEALLPWATHQVPLAGKRVLELGAGPGLTTDWLRPRVHELSAVELDPSAAASLQARLHDVDVRQDDATELPFPDASFDTVVCFTMLHHIPTDELQDKLFTEARRVLTPEGIFAGSDSRWGPLFAAAHAGDTMNLLAPDTLTARLSAAGFDNVDVTPSRHALRFRASVAT